MAKETITDELNAIQNPPETPDPLMEIGAVNNATDQDAADSCDHDAAVGRHRNQYHRSTMTS
ncbi:hypothetical protein E4U15_003838 [Claviceps sp. LM218 group G6]|nr:hypothetical protein E4U15_003838 [Claviceps sp. LM218 group G6]